MTRHFGIPSPAVLRGEDAARGPAQARIIGWSALVAAIALGALAFVMWSGA